MKLTRISAESESWPSYFVCGAWPAEELSIAPSRTPASKRFWKRTNGPSATSPFQIRGKLVAQFLPLRKFDELFPGCSIPIPRAPAIAQPLDLAQCISDKSMTDLL